MWELPLGFLISIISQVPTADINDSAGTIVYFNPIGRITMTIQDLAEFER